MTKRILVIEDDPALSNLMRVALERAKYEVSIADNGLEGLMRLDKDVGRKPDLVICDVMMPELDGLTLVRALRQRAETRGLPVIFVTAKTDSKSIAEGISLGARYYLTKPFTLEDFLSKVQKALGP